MNERTFSLWAKPQPIGDQDDEVDRADAGRVEVADLLADLAAQLESRDRRAEHAQLEERLLRRQVGARASQR